MLQNDRINLTVNEPLASRLKTIVERTAKEADASYAFLLLCDQGTSKLCNLAWYGREQPAESWAAIAQLVMAKGEPLYFEQEADAREILGRSLDKGALPLICVPVMSGNTIPRGVLIAGSPHSTGGELLRSLPLLDSLAQLTSALLEIANLQRELSHKEEQVRDIIRDTLDAQEKERERICLEVHDGVTQTLASAFQYLQTLETISLEGIYARQLFLKASALVKQAIQESREVINSLRPATLRDLGLVATLRQELRRMAQEAKWEIDFKADAIRLPPDVETGLYRIIHEAVTNARKHANTKRLRLKISSVDDRLKVEVRDWGVGFTYNPQDISRRRGTGLLSMRKRAELLQGTCHIQSAIGQGTVVSVEIPLGNHREQRGQDKGASSR